MGIIDEVRWTMTCPRCGKSETIRAVDRGSMWSGSHWSSLEKPKFFNAQTAKEFDLPTVKSANCTTCRVAATIEWMVTTRHVHSPPAHGDCAMEFLLARFALIAAS